MAPETKNKKETKNR